MRKHRMGRKVLALTVLLCILTSGIPVSTYAITDSEGTEIVAKVYQDDAQTNTGEDETNDHITTIRICNWEEYIDLGDWDEEELIELDNGVEILGENSMIEDFEQWYLETYGERVKVEYSNFGTNEDLYNQLNIGDTFDLVCPSEYMIMKLMAEDKLVPYSDAFFDTSNPENYYINGVSPFIRKTFEQNEIQNESWSKYAAGYMWGVTGTVYNPEKITKEEAESIQLYQNPKFAKRLTLKDNVRDTYFVTLSILYADQFLSEDFIQRSDYTEIIGKMMNDVSKPTIGKAQDLLQPIVQNVYSLETDSGKADMISGKVYGSYQWSGDAVYAMDQADEDDFTLKFAVPKECTNLWFDGWVMLKKGIEEDPHKQEVAERFVNFVSKPENAVRNMYYIGYTSVISGGEDDTVFNYVKWNYEEEDGEVLYPISYFFSEDGKDETYQIQCSEEAIDRQLAAQYPSEDVMKRAAVMGYYDERASKDINQMWINVRCFNLNQIPVAVWWCLLFVIVIGVIAKFTICLHISGR